MSVARNLRRGYLVKELNSLGDLILSRKSNSQNHKKNRSWYKSRPKRFVVVSIQKVFPNGIGDNSAKL